MPISRRDLLKSTGLSAGAALFSAALPSRTASAQAPEQPPAIAGKKLRLAAIGVGQGIGEHDLGQLAGHSGVQVVAICETDGQRRERFAKKHNAKGYVDYRNMFKEMAGQIDIVSIATPDHMHGAIALTAMSQGLHVYCQKPLANTIGEVRAMAKMAAEKKLITMMGNQKHTDPDPCTAVKWIQEGVIGKVKSVHAKVSSKDWGGVRQNNTPGVAPEWMDWDRYVGVAPAQPWIDGEFHTMKWRNRVGFGGGVVSDLGCHVFDVPFRALELGFAKSILSLGPKPPEGFFANSSHFRYTFPATRFTAGDVEFNYYCGDFAIPQEMRFGLAEPAMGSIIVGEKGAICVPHAGLGRFRIVDLNGADIPNEKLPPRSGGQGNHWHNWINAVIKQERTTDPIDGLGAVNTEAVLLGLIAWHWPNTQFQWDGAKVQFTGSGPDVAAANAMVQPKFRTGWTCPGINA